MTLREQLADGLDTLAVPWRESQLDQALEFLALIGKWNRIDNLTAITEPRQMVVHHLLDSLAVHPQLPPARTLLDVGSGAGLPGIPLAIFNPELRLTLLDAAAKRVRFIRHAVTSLGLGNVDVVQARATDFCREPRFDAIVSRAFARTDEFVAQTAPALACGGRMLAMKGRIPRQELDALPADFEYTVIPLQVPGLNAERHLITIAAKP